VRMDLFERSLLLNRVSDQLSDHDHAVVSSAMRSLRVADLVADVSDVVEVLSGRVVRPSPRRVSHGIGARVAAAHCDHHVEGFHRLEDLGLLGGSVGALSAMA
jgi:hypothetical protein